MEDHIKFLEDAAKYFENKTTDGEDKAHWANVFNAENCRKAAQAIAALHAENQRLRHALEKCANDLRDTYISEFEGAWTMAEIDEKVKPYFDALEVSK